jgi:phosphate transport system permease protein
MSSSQDLFSTTVTKNRLSKQTGSSKNDLADRIFRALMYVAGSISVAILLLMGWKITQLAFPAIQKFGLGFLTAKEWDLQSLTFGALPLIYGTIGSSAIALLIAIPVGLAVAILTSEDLLPQRLRTVIAFTIELIAAIPSVIFGLWGFYTLVPILLPLQGFLYKSFGENPLFSIFNFNVGPVPLFSTEPSGFGLFTAGTLLAIMILPTLAAVSREVLLVVPGYLRTGSMALGGTRWETISRVILPTAFSGIVGAVMLALGRALGETMAVTMVIGNATTLGPSIFEPAYSIPAILANTFNEAQDDVQIGSLAYLALILFFLTLVVNIGAVGLVRFVEGKGKK